MAIDIPMKLTESTNQFAIYEYSKTIYEPDPEKPKRQRACGFHIGIAKIDKSTGNIEQLAGQEWDKEGAYFTRVARVMIKNHLAGKYPEVTGYQA